MGRMATFAVKLVKLLEQRDWPQQRLRDVLTEKVSTGLINNWCSGKGPLPRLDQAYEIAMALNVDLDWLADDTQDMPPREAAAESPKLNEREVEILRIATLLGHDRALGRLLGMPVEGDYTPGIKR